jgi:hypothetical protein
VRGKTYAVANAKSDRGTHSNPDAGAVAVSDAKPDAKPDALCD